MEVVQSKRSRNLVNIAICGIFAAISMATPLVAQSAKSIRVTVVDKLGYEAVIAANKGKVIVVDCWATSCVPCRKAFPKTVEMSKTYANKDVVVISLCFDEVVDGKVPAAVEKFLKDKNAQFENLISSLQISGDGAEAFEIPDGALPHFKIYGKDGKLVKTFDNSEGKEFHHEDIEAAVKALINSK